MKTQILRRVTTNLTNFSKPAQTRGVHFVLDTWTIDDGLLTPTFKAKRYAIEAKYVEEVAVHAAHAVFT